jgi:hypothetical protein
MTDTAAGARPDLRHIDTWLFDLDNTSTPPNASCWRSATSA